MLRCMVWGLILLWSWQFSGANQIFLEAGQEFFAWRGAFLKNPAKACSYFEQEEPQQCRRNIWHRSSGTWLKGCPEEAQAEEAFPRYWRLVLTCRFPFLFLGVRQLQWEHLLLE